MLIDGGVTMLGAAALSAERNIPVLSLRNTGRLADVSAMHLMMDSSEADCDLEKKISKPLKKNFN